ncbi:DNA-binding transcriptional MerR regulator [Thiogranum longum]|uniref:DNA-binding transcriptional MerR regulator n=1 Tax=Thiogranum longum TaxID=1537524 RepID=A0A4R1HCQ8_9GAMM|nr:MerR family transcriptional regulator [Thiogranum longum]TCK18000.1 DNA-binding transcriptional MerR regulator [Thiogranum longum]
MYTLTVTDLANRSGATPHAVRYYTRMGLLRPKRNPDNGYRLYQYREVGWLRFIRQAKRLGYTLNEIREIMHDSDQGKSPCPRVREILNQRIDENRRQLEELMALQTRMEQALDQWENMPDGIPDGNSVCHLIESFAGNENESPGNKH